MAANIAQRAWEVERMGEYVGAFELVVWAHMEGVRVRLVVGGSLIDVLEYYSHSLPALPVDAREDIFVACNILVDGLSRKLLAVDTSDEAEVAFGHYVIGTRCRRGVPVSIGPVGSGVALRPVCLALGVAVVETQELGDCGVDAMCFHRGALAHLLVSSECAWILLSTCGVLPRMRFGSCAFRRARVNTPPSLLQGPLPKASCRLSRERVRPSHLIGPRLQYRELWRVAHPS